MQHTFIARSTLDCQKGGLITQFHNEVRNVLGNFAAMVHSEVLKELVMKEMDGMNHTHALVADLGVGGMWRPQMMALLDIHIFDISASPCIGSSVEAVLAAAESEKKQSIFIPFVQLLDGVLGCEARDFLKRLRR